MNSLPLKGTTSIRGRTYFVVPEDMAATHDIFNSAVLQEEVRLCREYLWSRYGNRDEYPPFHPALVREICQQSGTKTIFDTIVNALSCEGYSSKKEANENKAVAIIYILMFGQSQTFIPNNDQQMRKHQLHAKWPLFY